MMADEPTNLDDHRGMAEQKATDLRRMRVEVETDMAATRMRQQELEALLAVAPAITWAEAAEKARYLLGLFARTPDALDPRRQRLIRSLLDDFDRLLNPVSEGRPE
jgi:hypothetical protein